MELTDKIWQEFDGGYKVPYDASVLLRQLEQTNDTDKIKEIWEELWNELHHQGDVGLASYMAIPQLARIGKSKRLCDWNLFGLCCVIEQQRHLGDNPTLPVEFRDYYNKGLEDLRQLALECIDHYCDDTTYLSALSTLATCSGRTKLGKAILELEDKDILDEFLEQF